MAGLFEQRRERGELRVHVHQRPQGGEGAAETCMRAAVFRFVEILHGGLRCGHELAAVCEARVLGCQLQLLAGLEIEHVQLLQLVTEQVEPRIAIAHLRFNLELAVEQREPGAIRDQHLARERLEPAVAIEQLALHAGAHQRLELVLPMDVDEVRHDLAQHLHRHLLAIQIGARTTVRADDPAHEQLAVDRDGLLLEQLEQRTRRLLEVERGGNLGALGAVTDEIPHPRGHRIPPTGHPRRSTCPHRFRR